MAKEMELAHDLQMKLLPAADRLDWVDAGGRVQPAEQVGGDFYQLFNLPDGRIGVMLGDVSLHGFPSALITGMVVEVDAMTATPLQRSGATILPAASITCAPPEVRSAPMAAMRPSRIATSARIPGVLLPSITVPPEMIVSNFIVVP